jgi:hypothetical protein
MPYAIELYFDPATEKTIRDFWDVLAAAGIPSPLIPAGHRPHLTLAIYEGFDLERAGDDFLRFAGTVPPLRLTLPSIGIFPTQEGVLYIGVTPLVSLLDLHRRCHELLSPYTTGPREYYLPGRWVPHCTLTNNLSIEDIARGVPLCCQLGLPLIATVEEIGICEVSPAHCSTLTVHGVTG